MNIESSHHGTSIASIPYSANDAPMPLARLSERPATKMEQRKMTRKRSGITSETFTITELALMTGNTIPTIREVFKDRSNDDKSIKVVGKKRFYRISKDDVEKLLVNRTDGIFPLFGLFVFASACHNIGTISEENYQEIRSKLLETFSSALKYPATKALFESLLSSEDIDKTVMRLYFDSLKMLDKKDS